MVIESGAIYSAALITPARDLPQRLLVSVHSPRWRCPNYREYRLAPYFCSRYLISLEGVVFTLIIARIALGHSSEETGLPRVTIRNHMSARGSAQGSSGRPVEVQMTTYKQETMDSGDDVERNHQCGVPQRAQLSMRPSVRSRMACTRRICLVPNLRLRLMAPLRFFPER